MGANAARLLGGVRLDLGISPFPSRATAKLPWATISGFTTPNTTLAGKVIYRLNGPYDPEVAAGGGQPAGWDQYTILYKRYRVLKAHVTLTFSDPGAANYFCGYHLRAGTTSGSTSEVAYDDFVTRPFAEMQMLSTTGTRQREYRFTVVPSDVWGIPLAQLTIDDTWAALTASSVPSKETYLDVCCLNPYGAAVAATFAVKIEYEVLFSDPNILQDA